MGESSAVSSAIGLAGLQVNTGLDVAPSENDMRRPERQTAQSRLHDLEESLCVRAIGIEHDFAASELVAVDLPDTRLMRPPPPEWLIERGLQKMNLVAVHTGGCWTVHKSSRCVGASQAQALDALRQQVPACTHCRPDTALGLLE
ncbi:DUF6233 domain-containing protein [Streptomyces sp. NPDC001982]|uniref:DUF6233 domain-containing protein n=1 Tax=Streptomyces sp. NPDC001982 TaxID=3154405 RepID=UPI003324238B